MSGAPDAKSNARSASCAARDWRGSVVRVSSQLFNAIIFSLLLIDDKKAITSTGHHSGASGEKGCAMTPAKLDQMSIDDLWSLHVEVSQLLQQRIQQEKRQLEQRLKLLQTPGVSDRRPYPPVLPKYFNPDQPSETWSGRGRRPLWLVAQLKSGKRIDDLRVARK